MKSPPRLRLEPRPSRIACAAIGGACAAIAVLVLALPIDGWVRVAGIAWAAVVAARGIRKHCKRGAPALLFVGDDRRITVVGRDGRSRDGTILADTYVGARLTSIVWRPDRAGRLARAQSILVLPDSLPRDDFRRLRVMLRYGAANAGRATSGRAAARPSSHARPSTRTPLSALDPPPRR